MAISVPIVASFDGRGVSKAIKDFKALEGAGNKLGFVLKKSFLPAMAALTGLAAASGKALQAAVEDANAQTLLARSLKVSANATDQTVASVERYITSLGKSIGLTDNEARPAFATLALATKDVTNAQRLMAIAIDTSAATGTPLAAVAEAMSKGFAGNTKALKQLSPELFQLIKQGASAAEAFSVLETNFGGAAQVAAGTTAGQFKILNTSLGETTEAFGVALMPVLEAVLPLFQNLAKFVSDNVPFVMAIGVGVGLFATALVALRAGMVISTAASFALAAGLTAVQLATGIGIVAVGIAAAAFVAYKFSMKASADAAANAAANLNGLTNATNQLTGANNRNVVSQKQLNEFIGPVASRDIKYYRKSIADVAVTTVKGESALSKYTTALKLFMTETKQLAQSLKGIETAQLGLANATDDVRAAQDKFNKVSKGYGANSKVVLQATRDLTDARRDAIRATLGLKDATQSVADAQRALDDLKSGKATVTATQDLAYATQKVEDARKSLADAYIQGGDKTITDASQRLSDAYAEQRDAIDAVRQANDASSPNEIIKAEDDLTRAKLDLADAQDAVKDANQSVIDKQTELDEKTNGAATTTDIYKEALKELTDAQRNERDAVDALTDSYDAQTTAVRELAQAKQGLTGAGKGTTAKQEKRIKKALGFNAGSGIVNKPTLATIGGQDAGAVTSMSGDTSVINITVNTGVGDPVAIGKSIVDALQAYQRRSGALQIKVS